MRLVRGTNDIIYLSLPMKNHHIFKGNMTDVHSTGSNTLRQHIEAMPKDSILFRSNLPEYHAEFVGGNLFELANEDVLTKIAQGIYAKPRTSRFRVALPSVDKVVQAIAFNFILPDQAIESWKTDYADMRRFIIYGPS